MPEAARLVQLAVDEGKRLGHPSDAPSRGPVRGELPFSDPGDVFFPPVRLDRGRLDVHYVGLLGVVPLEKGEHTRLVRGVLVHGFRTRWIRGSPRGFVVTRGVGLESDRGLSDVACENIREDSDPPGRDLGKLVRFSLYRRAHG
jgi:hypothetical protein